MYTNEPLQGLCLTLELAPMYGFLGLSPVFVSFVFVCVTAWIAYRYWTSIRLPGPLALPLVGNLLQIDRKRPFLTLQKWHKQYGGAYKIQLPEGERLVVTNFEHLYEVLVSRGRDYAGRCSYWRGQYAYKGQGIGQNHKPGDKWRALRKLTHAHMKQYGESSGQFYDKLTSISERMYSKFEEANGNPINPQKLISRTVLKTLALLLTGKVMTHKDRIHHKFKQYVSIAFENLSEEGSWQVLLLDRFPWLRHFHVNVFSKVHKVKMLDKEIWDDIKELVRNEDVTQCLGQSLLKAVKYPARLKAAADVSISDFHAQRAALSVLLAGVGTTSMTFHAMINILATHPNVQINIQNEINQVLGTGKRNLTDSDKSKMPYTRAAVLELLRYTTIAAFGVVHKTLADTKLDTVSIPRGTCIITNLWGLHHDEQFWDEPYKFEPRRFLDMSGQVLPADDPRRTHLMPFGSGPRVCLGEGFVQARLFVWLANLCRRMNILPSDRNNQVDPDPRGYEFHCGLLRHPPYMVRFITRQ